MSTRNFARALCGLTLNRPASISPGYERVARYLVDACRCDKAPPPSLGGTSARSRVALRAAGSAAPSFRLSFRGLGFMFQARQSY